MSAQLTPLRGGGAARGAGSRAPAEQQVVLLAGGKRGQGTTTVAALLAILSASEGARVLLVDAAGGTAGLASLLGIQPEQAPSPTRDGSALLEEMVLPVSDTLSLLSVGLPAGDAARKTTGERRALLRWLPPLYARYDLVVIDAGSRLESIAALTASPPAKLIAVTSTDRVAVPSTYALVKALDARTPALPIEVLVNGAPAGDGVAVFRELDTAAQLFLQRRVDYAGAIPEDAGLRAATAAGIPVQQAAIDSPVVAAIQQLGARMRRELVHRSAPVPESRFSHWR